MICGCARTFVSLASRLQGARCPIPANQNKLEKDSISYICSVNGDIMPPRIRKLIGTLLLIALVVLYALIATTVASYRLAESPWWVHLIYFLVTGLLWILPAMWIIHWMEKPKKRQAK